MHDRLGQQTASLALLLGRLAPHVAAEGRVHLHRAACQVDVLNDEFRDLLADLHQPRRRQGDLQAMVAGLIAKWRDATGIDVEFVTRGSSKAITADQQLIALRLVQEALTNIMKHAPGASRVAVKLTFTDRSLIVLISDDGPGCPVVPGFRGLDGCYGLTGMRDRVRSQGGTLQIRTVPARGVTVRGRLPLLSSRQ